MVGLQPYNLKLQQDNFFHTDITLFTSLWNFQNICYSARDEICFC